MASCSLAKWTFLFFTVTGQVPDHLLIGINQLYHGGAYAYYSNDFKTAVTELEKALINYKMRQGIESSCHSKCENPDVQATKFNDEGLNLNWNGLEDSETLHFIRLLERTTCLKDCIAEHPFRRILKGPVMDYEVKYELDQFKPYNFLQISYHEIGEGLKAANAAYTYLSRHPDNEEMKHNLNFYQYHYPEVDRMIEQQELVNVELPNYNKLFQKGVIAYESGLYDDCISNFEKALIGYYSALKDCQNLCFTLEPQMDHFPSFWRNLADMEYTSALCQQKCENSVAAEVYNIRYAEPVGNILHYLQFCYYQTDNILQGANAVKTLTLISPTDTIAKSNLEVYVKKLKGNGNQEFQIRHREDVVRYLHQKSRLNNRVKFCGNFLAYRDEDTVDENITENVFELNKETIKKLINFDEIKFE